MSRYSVSGAGTTAYNGIYDDREVAVNNKPSYRLGATDAYLYYAYSEYDEFYRWVLRDSVVASLPGMYSYTAYSRSDDYDVPSGGTWITQKLGASPAPKVSEVVETTRAVELFGAETYTTTRAVELFGADTEAITRAIAAWAADPQTITRVLALFGQDSEAATRALETWAADPQSLTRTIAAWGADPQVAAQVLSLFGAEGLTATQALEVWATAAETLARTIEIYASEAHVTQHAVELWARGAVIARRRFNPGMSDAFQPGLN